jgi:diacylglycerol kinase family enzyme
MLASIRAVGLALSRPPVFEAEIQTALGKERRRVTAIAISNNMLGEGHVPYAEAVDRGVLGVYVVKPMPSAELARLALSLVFGSWKAHPLVSEREVSSVRLSFPRRKASARAVIDGELIPLERNIDLAIHARGLQVVLPATEQPATAEPEEAVPA